MNRTLIHGQHHADAGIARVRAYPCAIARSSWLAIFGAMTTNQKLRPRRTLRTS
jgi:hypothetical protein